MRSWESRSAALRLLPAVFGCIALVSVASEARSQAPRLPPIQYAAKYVCGSVSAKAGTPGNGIVAPGAYFTSINVHNPSNERIEFLKKFVIAMPSENPEGKISQLYSATLQPDGAFEIECADILRHLGVQQSFVKGFVVLLSSTELDVVAVYTEAATAVGSVVSMFMERVPKRP
jgi:hypothetical protein